MTDKYKYLDLPDNAPEWLKEAHRLGHVGVECKVWDDSGHRSDSAMIIHFDGNDFVEADGEVWDHAEPIVPEQSEDPRLAALQAGVVVTADNAVIGAEAISLRYGKVIIIAANLEYGRTECALLNIGSEEVSTWEADGKVYDSDMYPDLYYPAGKVPEREPECEVVKVKIRPFITAEQGHQALSHESTISMFDNSNFNGPEQEVEIKIYKPGKK